MSHRLLITGGSGYLGQFLVDSLKNTYRIVLTFNRHRPTEAVTEQDAMPVEAFHVDLETGDGLDQCLDAVGALDVVIHCAAMSSIVACEEDKERATKTNVPVTLIAALLERYPKDSKQPLFVHLSSDQVYSGTQSFWKESDVTKPVNHYGQTKIVSEQLIQDMWSNYAILRSSIIYGPLKRSVEGGLKFVDIMVQSLKGERPNMTFLSDEYRCPVFVEDIAAVVIRLIEASSNRQFQHVFNMGGPDRLSRADMARMVGEHLGIEVGTIREAKSAEITRKVRSPLDISVDMSFLTRELSIELTPFSEALPRILPS